MHKNIHREITQLKPMDSFLVFDRIKDDFDFPIHFHPEYELNFIHNGKGVRRVVGDHMEEIDTVELVLVGPNLVHGWELHHCKNDKIHEITVHIHEDLFGKKLLSRTIFKPIYDMFERSIHGILFSKNVSLEIKPRLVNLSKLDGIDYYLELTSIFHFLANSPGQKLLSTSASKKENFENSDRLKIVHEYVQENFHRKISLDEISELVNMTPVSFNRYIKKRVGRTFITYINDVRLSNATRLLIQTDLSIGDIGFKCGFNNIANFNRIFKKFKHATPSEFRKQFNGIQGVQRVL